MRPLFLPIRVIEQIEHLIQELPDVEFSILAHTNFAPEIMNLQSHLNVRLYPYFNPMNVKKVLEKIDLLGYQS